jgi:hypothetical protein
MRFWLHKGWVKKNLTKWNFVFLISQVQVIGSSKFLCISPIIRGVLRGVDTKILKIRWPGLFAQLIPFFEVYYYVICFTLFSMPCRQAVMMVREKWITMVCSKLLERPPQSAGTGNQIPRQDRKCQAHSDKNHAVFVATEFQCAYGN